MHKNSLYVWELSEKSSVLSKSIKYKLFHIYLKIQITWHIVSKISLILKKKKKKKKKKVNKNFQTYSLICWAKNITIRGKCCKVIRMLIWNHWEWIIFKSSTTEMSYCAKLGFVLKMICRK